LQNTCIGDVVGNEVLHLECIMKLEKSVSVLKITGQCHIAQVFESFLDQCSSWSC
jgi:hypothetical protein